MKKILVLLIILAGIGFVYHSQARMPLSIVGGSSAVDGSGCAYDYCQDFEETTEPDPPSGWTDTSPFGTINWDQTTGAINGSQSAEFDSDGDNENGASATYDFGDPVGTLYAFFKYKITTQLNNSTHSNFIQLRESAGPGICKYTLSATNYVGVIHGSATNTGTTTQLVQDQLYYIWLKCKTNTGGSNGEATIWVSTTGTKPGTAEATVTNGSDADTDLDMFDLRIEDRDIALVDDVYLDIAEIGNQ